MQPPSIVVATVNWNDFSNTAECLESLRRIRHPDFQVVVVDNGSDPQILSPLRHRFPEATFIENPVNAGLAAANNAALRHAASRGAEFCLLLNNDTVVDPEILEAFAHAARRHPDGGAFGAKIHHYHDPRRIWWATPRWDDRECDFHNIGCNLLDDGNRFTKTEEIAYANGCALFLRMAAVRRTGPMDERFFMYFEEIDWCFRARAAGFKSHFVPDAKLRHKVSSSSGGPGSRLAAYFNTRNSLLWAEKNLPLKQRLKFGARVFLSLLPSLRSFGKPSWFNKFRRDLRELRGPHRRARLRGIVHYFTRHFGDCPPDLRLPPLAQPGQKIAGATPLANKFCSRPFEWLEIQGRQAFFCCPGWISTPGITMTEETSVREIWNSRTAQEFRASILDGSFRHCQKNACIFMNQENVPWWEQGGTPLKDIGQITDPRLKEIIARQQTILEDGPLSLNAGYDRSCNLSCPSCRTRVIGLDSREVEMETAFQDRLVSEVGKGLKLLYVTGTGDPFASATYRKLLRGLSVREYPEMEIHLGTNATLWTRENWEAMHKVSANIRTAHISIDAATAGTYAQNRRGGNWKVLMHNLEFVSELRRHGPLRWVTLSFVVQQNNYHEMPAFIDMAQRFGFDLVVFQKFDDWGSMPGKEFRRKAVHLPYHREHARFLEILARDEFGRANVGLFCLHELREKALRVRQSFWGFLGLEFAIRAVRGVRSCVSLPRRMIRRLGHHRAAAPHGAANDRCGNKSP